MKSGKNAKNRLKIKEKAGTLAQENFQEKRKSAEKRNYHTPVVTNFIGVIIGCLKINLR